MAPLNVRFSTAEQPIILTTRDTRTKYPRAITASRCFSRSGISTALFSGQRLLHRKRARETLAVSFPRARRFFKTLLATSKIVLSRRTGRIRGTFADAVSHRSYVTLISRESSPTCVDFYIPSFLHREMCRNAHAISSVFCASGCAVRNLLTMQTQENFPQMDAEGKNFSARRWTGAGVPRNAAGKRKGKRVRKWAGQRVYEVPEDRMPSKRSTRVARKQKSVISPCVTRITRASLRKIRSVGRSNAATLMRFLFASPLNLPSYMTASITFESISTSVENGASGSAPPAASTQRLLCHPGKIDVTFWKNGTVAKYCMITSV